MEAMPMSCTPIESNEHVKRNVFCSYYLTCLDHAIDQDWMGFSCEACQGYECEPQMDCEQREEERGRCMALLYFVLMPDLKLQIFKIIQALGKEGLGRTRDLAGFAGIPKKRRKF